MANKRNGQERGPLPPYISFKTFQGFVQKLKDTVVPPRIDGSLLRSYSGSVARQLVAALRWLQLIDEANHSTEKLRGLVKSYGSPEWSQILGGVIVEGYHDVIGDLDTDNATLGSLSEKFKAKGAEGHALKKCLAFYIAALKAASISFSPHFTEKQLRFRGDRHGAGRSRREQVLSEEDGIEETPEPPTRLGTVKFSFPVPDKPPASIFVPSDLSPEDWEMIDGMMRMYIQRLGKRAG